ncbi:MAG TPA: hypothetical protein VMS31_12840 [Pyrinomonadaceae bacterium]|nr:hypothetical protein [Pyrinomonadaceae bacterium]
MSALPRILLSALVGTIICAGLSFLIFFLLTVFDNQRLGEAFAYGLIVGLIGGFVGLVIGSAVGLANLGVVGGGVAGLLLTLIIVLLYVFSAAGSSGRYLYFLTESKIILVVLGLPLILTGAGTALLKRVVANQSAVSSQQSAVSSQQ